MGWGLSVNSALGRGRAGRTFLAGTVALFLQAAAPIGWTRVTTNDDSLIRVNGTNSLTTGGSNGFTATFNTQTQTGSQNISTATTGTGSTGTQSITTATTIAGTSGSTTITISTLPAHTHTYDVQVCTVKTAGACAGQEAVVASNTGSNGSDGSHNHSIPSLTVNTISIPALSIPSLAVNTFTVGPLSLTTSIKYKDALRASKN